MVCYEAACRTVVKHSSSRSKSVTGGGTHEQAVVGVEADVGVGCVQLLCGLDIEADVRVGGVRAEEVRRGDGVLRGGVPHHCQTLRRPPPGLMFPRIC